MLNADSLSERGRKTWRLGIPLEVVASWRARLSMSVKEANGGRLILGENLECCGGDC